MLKGTLVTGLRLLAARTTLYNVSKARRTASTGVPRGEPPSPNDGRPATLTELLGLEDRLGTKREPPPKRGNGVARQPPHPGKDVGARTRSRNIASRGQAAMGTSRARPEPLARPRAAVAFGSTGPLPASPPRRPRARVAPPSPRRPAPPPPARKKKVLPEAARAALFDRLQRPASAPVKKRAVHSGPTWIIGRSRRPGYVAPPRKSLRSADARKVVERLPTGPDCAGEGECRPTRGACRPAKRRRRKKEQEGRAVVSVEAAAIGREARERLKRSGDAVFAAERGVERTAEDAVGLQNLSRLAAARPPPPTRPAARAAGLFRGPRAPPAAVVADVWRSARAPAHVRQPWTICSHKAADLDQGYASRRPPAVRADSTRGAPRARRLRYRATTAVGAVEVAASPSGEITARAKRAEASTSLLRQAGRAKSVVGTAMVSNSGASPNNGRVVAATRGPPRRLGCCRRTPRSTTRGARRFRRFFSFSFSFSPSSEPV